MAQALTINPRIVENLYCEALVLSEEVRAAFAMPESDKQAPPQRNLARVAVSCESLRTITRMMQAQAWLLNHRAYFKGEITEFQLRRYGNLSANSSDPQSERLPLIDAERRELIGMTERFYERLQRLERGWRNSKAPAASAVTRLHERLGSMGRATGQLNSQPRI